MRLLTESSESVRLYEAAQQDLEITVRLLEQSKAEHGRSAKESQAIVEELKGRESELRDSIGGLGLRRDRIEERLAALEADAEAGLLKRPPATSGREDEGKTQERDDVRDDRRKRGEGRVEIPEQGRDGQDREEEEKDAESTAVLKTNERWSGRGGRTPPWRPPA